MGLTREEALKILGLTESDSRTVALYRYRELAVQYHPHINGEKFLSKFQQIVAAYVRVRIEPDDCDQMKLKLILAELYDINQSIIGKKQHKDVIDLCPDNESVESHDDNSQDDDEEDNDDMFSGSSTGGGGPYDAVLQDFMIRSYLSKSRRNKPQTFSTSTEKKSYVTEEERAVALRQANELMREEEEGRLKEEKRRQRNKRKKEAKKRRKCGGDGSESRFTANVVSASSKEVVADTYLFDDEEAEIEDEGEEGKDEMLDMNSAFIVRLMGSGKVVNSKPSSGSSQSSSAGSSSKSSPSSEKHLTLSVELPLKQDLSNGVSKKPKNKNETAVVLPMSNGTSRSGGGGGDGGGSRGTTKLGSSQDTALFTYSIEESRRMAVLGNKAAKEGRFEDAILNFTEAINLYPDDHRYYGNRSFCFDFTKDYKRALADAEKALFLHPEWAKGYFRKGRALLGLERIDEAENFYLRAVELDPNYRDACEELRKLRLDQITNMGFDEVKAEEALSRYGSVQSAVDALLAGKVKSKLSVGYKSSSNSSSSSSISEAGNSSCSSKASSPQLSAPGWSHCANLPPRLQHLANPYIQCRALWVGNIDNGSITEEMLIKLFARCGQVESIRMLPARFCAFVNFKEPESAARALKELQDASLDGCNLLLRYPENPQASSFPSLSLSHASGKARALIFDKKSGPVNGDECYFWRTTGCHFGDRCHHRHVAKHKGIDLQLGKKKR